MHLICGDATWYDDRGDDTLSIHYDKDNLPTDSPYVVRKWYTSGYLHKVAYFDAKFRAVNDTDGMHGYVITRDFKNYVDTIMYIDTLDQPMADANFTYKVKQYTNGHFNKVAVFLILMLIEIMLIPVLITESGK